MLSDYVIHPSLATADVAKAREWYAQRLGLEPILEFPSLLVYQVESTMFTVFETPTAGTAMNTVAVWRVHDLRADVKRLRDRGLIVEDLDFGPGERTVDGIMTSEDPEGSPVLNAWFRDGDGNWISMVEQVDHAGEGEADFGIGASLAASDLNRARAWYADKLGLEPARVYKDEELVYRQGASRFTIFTTPTAGTARNTVAVWRVRDLRAEVAALRLRGVEFNEYDLGDLKTIDGIAADPDGDELAAWFTDSEGNTLGLVEDLTEPVRPR